MWPFHTALLPRACRLRSTPLVKSVMTPSDVEGVDTGEGMTHRRDAINQLIRKGLGELDELHVIRGLLLLKDV